MKYCTHICYRPCWTASYLTKYNKLIILPFYPTLNMSQVTTRIETAGLCLIEFQNIDADTHTHQTGSTSSLMCSYSYCIMA